MTGDSAGLDDLVRATARTDKAAFHRLYDAISPKLFGICLRICQERAMAEDALQDTFVEIWRNAARFDPARGSAIAWMSVIARNRAIDLLRARGRPEVPAGDAATLDGLAPGSIDTANTEYLALIDCLGRLDNRTRDMVLLAYYEGWSRNELAARYESPQNTVKSWLRRGLASLRQCLEE
ncbi:MAG: sigma-70 family RNA polymerase sigma factor [Pseudomonadota bacterium]